MFARVRTIVAKMGRRVRNSFVTKKPHEVGSYHSDEIAAEKDWPCALELASVLFIGAPNAPKQLEVWQHAQHFCRQIAD
jgi:hypothetical protein